MVVQELYEIQEIIEIKYDQQKRQGYYKLQVRLFEYIRLDRGLSLEEFYKESGIIETEYSSIRFDGETGRFEDVRIFKLLLEFLKS